eukprot:1161686-Pelagomonas_calceolata.AAC.3
MGSSRALDRPFQMPKLQKKCQERAHGHMVPTLHHTSRMPIPSKPKWRAVEQGTQDPESLLQLELAELEQKLQSIRAKQNDLAC